MKALISIIGKDKLGIISNISALLTQLKINIEDISQTVVKDNFSITIKVETQQCEVGFEEVAIMLDVLGQKLGVDIAIKQKNITRI